MPAGGDNKPKTDSSSSGSTSSTPKQQFIGERKAIASKPDKKSNAVDNLLVALAVILFLTSFVAACFFAIQPKVHFGFLIAVLTIFVSSIYYLYRKYE